MERVNGAQRRSGTAFGSDGARRGFGRSVGKSRSLCAGVVVSGGSSPSCDRRNGSAATMERVFLWRAQRRSGTAFGSGAARVESGIRWARAAACVPESSLVVFRRPARVGTGSRSATMLRIFLWRAQRRSGTAFGSDAALVRFRFSTLLLCQVLK